MTGPRVSMIDLYGPGSEYASREYQRLTTETTAILDSLLAQLGGMRTGLPPQIPMDQAVQQLTPMLRPGQDSLDEEAEDLIAAARFYGIEGAEQMPREILAAQIDGIRKNIERPDSIGLLGGALLGAARGVVGAGEAAMGMIENIPFVGDWLSKVTGAADAEIWYKSLDEGLRANQPEVDMRRYNWSNGLGMIAGYIYPGSAALKVAGLAGRAPILAGRAAKMTPLMRAAVRGSFSTWMLEGGSDRPVIERVGIIALGGAADAGFEKLAPIVAPHLVKAWQRLETAFPRAFKLQMEMPPDLRAGFYEKQHYQPINTPYGPAIPTRGVVRGLLGPGEAPPPVAQGLPPEINTAPPFVTEPTPSVPTFEQATEQAFAQAEAMLPPRVASPSEILRTKVVGEDGFPRVVYHGTTRQFDRYDPNLADPESLYGPGFYHTEDIRIAGGDPVDAEGLDLEQMLQGENWWLRNPPLGYATPPKAPLIGGGAAGTPTREEAAASAIWYRERANAIRAGQPDPGDGADIDFLGPVEPEMAAATLEEMAKEFDSFVAKSYPNVRPARLLIERPYRIDGDAPGDGRWLDRGEIDTLIQVARQFDPEKKLAPTFETDFNPYMNYSAEEMWLRLSAHFTPSGANQILREAGYDGITHIGGGLTGNEPHRVWIAFDPDQVYSPWDALPMSADEAVADAAVLSQQAMVMESPALAPIVGQAVIQPEDALRAAQASEPDAVTIFGKRDNPIATPNATPEQIDEYMRLGMFTGQRATVNGVEAIVSKPAGPSGMVTLKRINGGPPLRAKASTIVLQPFAPPRTEDLPPLYEPFKKWVNEVMESAGLPQRPDWLDDATSEQIPRLLDQFLDDQGITDPALRASALRSVEQRRLEDYRALAPDEDAIAADIEGQLSATTLDDQSIDELAEQAAMRWVPEEGTGRGALRFEGSSESLPFESPEAARQFLLNIYKGAPDVGPLGNPPLEVMRQGPHGPGNSKDPQTRVDDVLDEATPTPMTDADAQAFAHMEAQQEAWQDRAAASLVDALPFERGIRGAAAGAPPPPPPPPTGGPPFVPGGDEFGPFPMQGPRTLKEYMQAELGGKTPEIGDILRAYDGFIGKALMPIRNRFLAIEDKLERIGVSLARPWQSYSTLTEAIARQHNDSRPWLDQYSTIMAKFDRAHLRKGDVTRIHEIEDPALRAKAMQDAGYSPREIAADEELTQFNHNFFTFLVGDPTYALTADREIARYMSHIRNRQALGKRIDWENAERQYLSPNTSFFAEYVRTNAPILREMDAREIGAYMVRAAFFKKHVAEPWGDLVTEWNAVKSIDPDGQIGRLADIVLQWADIARKGYDPSRDLLARGVAGAANSLGIRITEQEAVELIQTLQLATYRSLLGGRPAVLFRDAIQPMLAGTRVGFSELGATYRQYLSADATGKREMMDRALRLGWVERGVPQLESPGVFERTLEGTAGSVISPEQAARREALAAVGDVMRDMLPPKLRHIQGTWLDPLQAYTRLGEFNRMFTGETGYRVAREAIGRWRAGEIDFETMMGQSRARTWENPIQRRYKDYLEAGDDESAAILMGNELANWSQQRYGVKETPEAFRGMFGRIGLQFGNFTLQYIQTMKSGLSQGTVTDRARFLAGYGAITLALGYMTAKTGWNFSNWMWHKSLSWAGGPGVQPALTAVQAVSGGVESLSANVEGTEAVLSPQQQEGLRAASGFLSNPMEALSMFNPYRGVIQTGIGLEQAGRTATPHESVSRYLVTGQGVDSQLLRMLQAMPLEVTPTSTPTRGDALAIPNKPPSPILPETPIPRAPGGGNVGNATRREVGAEVPRGQPSTPVDSSLAAFLRAQGAVAPGSKGAQF